MYLVVGLGNPGRQYEATRHNMGFDVIDRLVEEHRIPQGGVKFNAMYGKGIIGGEQVLLMKPLSYMNLSGGPVRDMANYFKIEKGIYEQVLSNPDEVVTGTVKELAEKYGQEVLTMVGFLDGINDSLKIPNPIETMDENTKVSLCFDKELLYKNMVDARADWLYELPQWDAIFTPEKRKELYLEQKKSGTVVKAKKIGRNDPCPCGSGKKYKYCCGKNA